MYLEIVSPEATLFSGEVDSVAVPGTNGSFQMLNHHAPIVSALEPGKVIIYGSLEIPSQFLNKFSIVDQKTTELLLSSGGAVEMRNNKIIVLAD